MKYVVLFIFFAAKFCSPALLSYILKIRIFFYLVFVILTPTAEVRKSYQMLSGSYITIMIYYNCIGLYCIVYQLHHIIIRLYCIFYQTILCCNITLYYDYIITLWLYYIISYYIILWSYEIILWLYEIIWYWITTISYYATSYYITSYFFCFV